MGGLEAIHKYVAVLAILVAFPEFLITQGRQIKSLNQHLTSKDTTLFDINVTTSAEKVVDSSTTPNQHMNAVSEESNRDHVSAYRPTNPGTSPGVGHRKFGEETKDIKAKVVVQSPPNGEYSLAEGSKTDFRPTDPGHSPGVGHSAHQNKNNGEVGRVQN
ncbi:precursor of CEP9-like [Neltuma alba]|uniref:precursor of CEP9-like n=1 Tax=Neltuma alba TaxID=207710 RepID=UPI0010A407F6|nr:precursor of CEP9-like [Prosopis alba]